VVTSPLAGVAASSGIACAVTLGVLYALPSGRRALRDFREVASIVLKRRGADLSA
jgi:hypothetical protein